MRLQRKLPTFINIMSAKRTWILIIISSAFSYCNFFLINSLNHLLTPKICLLIQSPFKLPYSSLYISQENLGLY